LKLMTLYLPEPYIKALDGLVEQKLYPNRAEAIRFALHDFLDAYGLLRSLAKEA